jgi:hypothetical protein
LQILEDTGKILVLPVLCTNIVVPVSRPLEDSGKILVIPVLQIPENTRYTSIADIGRLGRIPVNRVLMSTI